MGAVYFYHLTRSPVTATVFDLLGKCLANDWRVVVQGQNFHTMQEMDVNLWKGAADSFLAHGLSNGKNDADQPVLLTVDPTDYKNRQVLMVVEDAEFAPEDANKLERVCILFDGNDASSVDKARAKWKSVTDAGISAQYWSQETGNWQQKAKSN
jgi:DNA polymerase-3 subunit chi